MLARVRLFGLLALAPMLAPLLAQGAEPDWRAYGQLLNEYVTEGTKDRVRLNLVDYSGLRGDPRFAGVVESVRAYDVTLLDGKEERLAFYINAYNILTIQLILDHWPVESIRDIGNFFRGPWDRVMLENADGALTLDDIEHRIIRPLGEARIHFAVNCASVSCPDLRREPYTAAQLDTQLDDQTERFLAEPRKGLSVKQGVAHVSRIFDWYGDDFGSAVELQAFLQKHSEIARSHEFKGLKPDMKYNWQLNGQ